MNSKDHELLLEWISERGTGSWSHLRDACAWLGSHGSDERSAWSAIHQLEALAHLDVDLEAQRWSVAPAVLTMLPGAGGYALATGARTRTLSTALRETVADSAGLYLKSVQQPGAPNALYLQCEREHDVEALASHLGVAYDAMVSDRLSRILPELVAPVREYPDGPPNRGFEVERFSTDALGWTPAQSMDRPGLFRVSIYWQVQTWWSPKSDHYARVLRPEGIYLEMRRTGRHVLRWERDTWNGSLILPVATPLPVLHARAATLCTGMVPEREDGGLLRYMNVPHTIAERIARSLGQELEIRAPSTMFLPARTARAQMRRPETA